MGQKSANLWVVRGCGVPFLAYQFEPEILQTFQFCYQQKFPG